MDVITTHVNADFDCLGAMVAARKLYPEALMVFSGSQEKSMRDFFLKSTGYVLNFHRIKDIDFSAITRLILVDCQHTSRIGKFAEIVGRPGLEIHIYDHHPETHGDIAPTSGEIRLCGSSTAILARILMDRGIEVNPTEATLMMLGIYEDTGNLTFPSTSVDDYRAASWLLERGANLNTVAEFVTQELTAEQMSLLGDLIRSLKNVTLDGVEVSVAHATRDYYVGDIAVLAHMIRDMENLQAIFLVVEMGSRVHMVARSRVPEVDVGEILREFGGGGHATAASASVKGLTLIQVMEKLSGVLCARITPARTARFLMSTPVKTVSADTTIAEAGELLVRYNIHAMPVMQDTTMVGIISRNIVEKSLYHDLGHLLVSEYMHTEFLRATPDTEISAIQDYIIGQNRRFVPIFENEQLVGAVTRSDLLRYMYAGLRTGPEPLYDLAVETLPEKRRGIEGAMARHLPPTILRLLQEMGRVGDELALPVYAVGGFVRDLLLRVENVDVDITVEGDGILFAETFAGERGCRVKSHAKFGTAVIIFPDGFKVDVASTRLEYYESPGALPTVERSSLKHDLYRRDFTINTLAICLNRQKFGQLIDYFGGQRDISERVIRVLHNLSFVEDPTRVFRAVRFEQRLDFHIARHTENLVKNAVRMNFLEKLGGRRLLTELILILRERDPLKGIERMASFNLLQYLHPELKLDLETRRVLEEAHRIVSWYELLFLDQPYERWGVYFLSLCQGLDSDQFWGACIRLSVPEHYRDKLLESRKRGEAILQAMQREIGRGREIRKSEVYRWMLGMAVEVLLYTMAKTDDEEVKKHISLYFTHLQGVHRRIGGEELKRLGVPRGPLFGKILDEVLSACLDGEAVTLEDELRIAGKAAKVLMHQ
ncbi:MAG: CBS domain-containing protein [Geobacter sp.]|nr:CBS domain-containing protein [Geobacter sp.]